MKSNFEFLKKDKKLFKLASEAENLFRDGYFEQCIIQTRKFGETLAKNLLGVRRTTEETFDEVLGTLEDIIGKSPNGKEFIQDLYFLKKQGNLSAHGSARELGSKEALDCLKRAFEAGVYFAIQNGQANKKFLNLRYDAKLLVKELNSKEDTETPQSAEGGETEGVESESENSEEKPIEPDNKVIVADFKNKKTSQKKEAKAPKKTTGRGQKKTKRDKKEPSEKEIKAPKAETFGETFIYAVTFGVLFVLFVCIMIFVLPM